MLTENQVLLLSEPVEKMYADASAQLLINIAKHLGEGEITDLEAWQIERLTEISKLSEENAEIIAANTMDKGSEIQDSVEKAVESTVEDVDKECQQLSIVEKGIVAAVVINLANRARQDTTRVDATMLQSSIDEYRTAISDVVQYYRSAELKRILRDTSKLSANTEGAKGIIDQAIKDNAFYAKTRKEAIQDAIKKLADRGIVGFIDKGGHHWTADAYVAMDIRTTLSNAAIEGQKARAEEYGVHTFQISVKTPARELCAPYQGWICSWNGERGTVYDLNGKPYTLHSIYDTSYGEPAGIFGISCGHRPLTFVDGYSVPQYQPMSAKERKENDEVYKLTQKQRAQEREIRKLKTQAVALDAAGEEIPSSLAYQIKDKTQAYKDFCQQNKLVERLERTRVVGYNRSVSSKATEAVKRAEKAKIAVEEERLKQEQQRQEKIAEVRELIKSDATPKRLNIGKQNEHIKESNSYKEGKSYIYGDLNTAQEIVDKYYGTGEIVLTRSGEWNHKEVITATHDLGIAVFPDTKSEETTNRATIHYSKKGTHVVPTRREKKE